MRLRDFSFFISYEETKVPGDILITLFGVDLFTILVSLTILYMLTNFPLAQKWYNLRKRKIRYDINWWCQSK
jgi:hypothetical protein